MNRKIVFGMPSVLGMCFAAVAGTFMGVLLFAFMGWSLKYVLWLVIIVAWVYSITTALVGLMTEWFFNYVSIGAHHNAIRATVSMSLGLVLMLIAALYMRRPLELVHLYVGFILSLACYYTMRIMARKKK